MRPCLVLLVMVTAARPAAAFEITADMVVAAWRLGSPVEVLTARIVDPANAVVSLSPADEVRLEEAGVPGAVRAALRHRLSARAALSLPTSAPTEGAAAVPPAAPPQSPATVIRTAAPAQPASPAQIPAEAQETVLVLDRLSLIRSRVLGIGRPGRLLLDAERLTWSDATDPAQGFETSTVRLRKLWPRCDDRPQGKVCRELLIQLTDGEGFTLRELETGGRQVVTLVEALRARNPNLPIEERPGR